MSNNAKKEWEGWEVIKDLYQGSHQVKLLLHQDGEIVVRARLLQCAETDISARPMCDLIAAVLVKLVRAVNVGVPVSDIKLSLNTALSLFEAYPTTPGISDAGLTLLWANDLELLQDEESAVAYLHPDNETVSVVWESFGTEVMSLEEFINGNSPKTRSRDAEVSSDQPVERVAGPQSAD